MQARNVHAPQVGFNNNVRHKGKVYHIQTEDSGVNYARITTHLFADGGRILRSERTDYSELLGSKELATELRKRMKEQHRAMFVALREGQLDHLIEGEAAPFPDVPALRTSADPTTAASPATSAAPAAKPAVSARPRLAKVEIGPVASDANGSNAEADRTSATRVSERCSEPSRPTHVSGGHGAVRPSLEGVEPAYSGGSIFGTASISEQSLDDVILSYISDDLDSE